MRFESIPALIYAGLQLFYCCECNAPELRQVKI